MMKQKQKIKEIYLKMKDLDFSNQIKILNERNDKEFIQLMINILLKIQKMKYFDIEQDLDLLLLDI